MHNIEKSAFQKGQYVGYGGGAVWHIRNYGKGNWKATPQGNNKHQVFSCATLRDVSTQLETLGMKPMDETHRKSNPAPRKRAVNKSTPKSFDKFTKRQLQDFITGCHNARDYGPEFTAACYALNSQTTAPRKTNPAPRKRAISRPSQITKKAPSKRLVARRKVAAKKPVKGYFPNPRKDEFLVQVCSPISVPLASRKWTTVLKFKTEKEAKETALQMARIDRLDRSWRVMKK